MKLLAVVLLFWAAAAYSDTFPVIEELTPAQGAIEGGTVITLRGKNLARPASTLSPCTFTGCEPSVAIAGKYAELVDVAADGSQLRVRTPSNAGGTYDLVFAFRTKTTFQGHTLFSGPIDGGVTLKRAFTYGRGGYERVLVPIFAKGETPGAFGSRWVTELVGWNPSFFAVGVYQTPPPTSPNPLPNPDWGAPMSTFRPQLNGPGTAFLYTAGTGSLAFSLRVRDVTRQSESFGTEIPVVPESQAIAGAPILLNDIPRDADSRIMLRIYDFDGPTGGKVDLDVSFGDASPNEQFASETIDLPAGVQEELPSIPGYVQVDLTSELATLDVPFVKNAKSLRVSVAAHDTNKRLWAFVTVTNNRTQQITTVTP
jgi:hypothetical protein